MTFVKTITTLLFANKSTAFLGLATLSALYAVPAHAQSAVNLGTAANYTILSKTGITNVATSAITGDIAVSPIAASAITGFALSLSTDGTFSTSTQVTGSIFAASYTAPTPAVLSVAIGDMTTAYNNAVGQTPTLTELHAGDLSGKTLVPGVYSWSTSVLISNDVTLNGGPNALWVFQIAQNITQAAGARVILTGGAKTSNIVWLTGGTVTLGAGAHMEGVILAGTSMSLGAAATVNGRLMANTSIALIQNTIVAPVVNTSSEIQSRVSELSLSQNFPNPFNPTTQISFVLPQAGTVQLTVVDMLGRSVEVLLSGAQSAGSHTVTWNASRFTSGVYLVRLNAGGQTLTRTMTLTK